MRLGISNIAWDIGEDDIVAALLQTHRVDAIDVAPGKYFPQPVKTTAAEVAEVKDWWADRGIEITGMQALLFGTTGLNLFGAKESQRAMLQHLRAVCEIGAGLGARRLVFGSPGNRDRSGLGDSDSIAMAIPFFRKLGDIASANEVIICLEPTPVCYGANFMATSDETARVVEQVDHPSIRMQLDTGAMTINSESPGAVLSKHAHLIGHVHASEPELLPLGNGGTDHGRAHAAIKQHLPGGVVTIEMLATQDVPHEVSIKSALEVAIRCYRNHGAGGNR